MVKKHPMPWTWQHMFVPSVHHRPPFPMSARQRLYEIRKRCRKTEIPSVRLWAVNEKLLDYCDYCTTFMFDECEANVHGNDGCPLSHDRAVFRRQVEAKARFHRPTLRERRYERRKRSSRRRFLKMHGYYRRKYPDVFRAFRAALYFTSPSFRRALFAPCSISPPRLSVAKKS